jgi:hypothetical protein
MKTIKIDNLIKWIEENALGQTTYSDVCSDDGTIEYKKTETEKRGDWSQEDWQEYMIDDFEPRFIDYNEILEYLKEVQKR